MGKCDYFGSQLFHLSTTKGLILPTEKITGMNVRYRIIFILVQILRRSICQLPLISHTLLRTSKGLVWGSLLTALNTLFCHQKIAMKCIKSSMK
jgi:hypothetical protein